MRRILLAAALVVAMMTGAVAGDVTEIWSIEEPVGILVLDDGRMFEVTQETVVVMSEEPVVSALSSEWVDSEWVDLVYDDGHAGTLTDIGDIQLIALVREPGSKVIEAY